ncbi:HutD/Ves family protein [Dyella caseinilytica]|uniref:HutD family protein n=1 Tax=Dyella caseinilytica TaxID=1849581 RepID=A0ABX7GW50_9GAMM|nr:HutD family protein [Dyella caseinilytica]QRN54099.1 HutD family protein [Dyella caseinilytica]
MSIIRLRDCRATPWKNGMGRTRELAVHPAGAGMDDFIWRVSVAEVDSAAPFSAFPGIDRYIALLEGAGFTMTLDDERTHALTTPFSPFAFPGEAQVNVALQDGPTRDFNLMLRRAKVRGELVVWDEPGRQVVDVAVALIYCAQGHVDTSDGRLQAGDAWIPVRSIGRVTLDPDTLALVVRVESSGN